MTRVTLCALAGWVVAMAAAIICVIAINLFSDPPKWVFFAIGFPFGLFGPFFGLWFAKKRGWI